MKKIYIQPKFAIRVLEWMEKWRFGMAMHGEQKGESIHREFNIIERNMCHVPNLSQKLLFIMREHHTLTHPEIQSQTEHKKTKQIRIPPNLKILDLS